MNVLEKLFPIDRKLNLDKIKSTSAQCTMKPKFRIRKYQELSHFFEYIDF